MSPAEYLFGEYRRRILALVFMRSDRSFYVREVADLCGLPVGSVHRELVAAWEAGVLTRRTSGRQVYFQANPQSPIFSELKRIIRKTAGFADTLRDALQPVASDIELALVYGSMASGRERPGSDVDLLIVGEVSMADVVKLTSEAQSLIGREVNPAVLSREAFDSGMREGDRFVAEILSGEKIWLKGSNSDIEEPGEDRPT